MNPFQDGSGKAVDFLHEYTEFPRMPREECLQTSLQLGNLGATEGLLSILGTQPLLGCSFITRGQFARQRGDGHLVLPLLAAHVGWRPFCDGKRLP